jgi:hypothetical protein
MISAVMAQLPILASVGLAGVVCRGWHLRPRPFAQNREEARDVRGDLLGVVMGQITTETRLPNVAGASDHFVFQVSFTACDGFTEDITGGFSSLRAPGLRSRNHSDDARP